MEYTSREVYEYVSKQTNDPIVERRKCAVSGADFPIYASDDMFYDKIGPIFDGKKFTIPRPTLCPEERQRRRLLFRNERKLYKRKCDATGGSMVSLYSPDKLYKVYHKDYRRSDKRDALQYGFEYDVASGFSSQFDKLYKSVPKCSLNLMNNENVEYGNDVEQAKNSYMVFNAWDVEDSYYASATGPQCCSVVDSYRVNYSDIIYEGVYLVRCHEVFYSSYCNDCSFCRYCTDCQACQFCYDCHGLQNKQYCIGNQQYTKDTYHAALAVYQRKDTDVGVDLIRNVRSENSIGNNIIDSASCYWCYGMVGCNECKYSTDGLNFDTAYDATNCGTESTNVYESIGTYFVSYSGFTVGCSSITRSWYCIECFSCSDCFGCVGLRNKQYCIFNKQYTKIEYEKRVADIISAMQDGNERGSFFSHSLALFGYNETVAIEYMCLEEDVAKERGYKWLDINYDPVMPPGVEVMHRDQFDDVGRNNLLHNDKILKAIFICQESQRPYRLISQEVDFYKKYGLQLPSLHPDVRHLKRIQKKNIKPLSIPL